MEKHRQKLIRNRLRMAKPACLCQSSDCDGEAQIETNRSKLKDGETQLAAARAQLADGEQQIASYRQTIQSGEAQLAAAKQELSSQEKQLNEQEQKLADAEKELADGQKEYEDGLQTLDEKTADAKEKIADAQKQIDEIQEPDVYVLGRDTNIGYASYENDSMIVAGIAKVLPFFFFPGSGAGVYDDNEPDGRGAADTDRCTQGTRLFGSPDYGEISVLCGKCGMDRFCHRFSDRFDDFPDRHLECI